jgi:hypothetical protein
MTSVLDEIAELRVQESILLNRIQEAMMRGSQSSSYLGYLQSDLEEIRRRIKELQTPAKKQEDFIRERFPTLFEREPYLPVNGGKFYLNNFDRLSLLKIIQANITDQGFTGSMDPINAEIARITTFNPNTDSRIDYIFGTLPRLIYLNKDTMAQGINWSSTDPYAIRIPPSDEIISISGRTFNLRSYMLQTRTEFLEGHIMSGDVLRTLSSIFTKEPDPIWLASLGYLKRRLSIVQWVKSRSIRTLQEAKQYFAANWPAMIFTQNDMGHLGENWDRILAISTGYTLQMLQASDNAYVFDQAAVDQERMECASILQNLISWQDSYDEQEQRVLKGILGIVTEPISGLFSSPLLWAGLGVFGLYLLKK